jgi:hypothetical protein
MIIGELCSVFYLLFPLQPVPWWALDAVAVVAAVCVLAHGAWVPRRGTGRLTSFTLVNI